MPINNKVGRTEVSTQMKVMINWRLTFERMLRLRYRNYMAAEMVEGSNKGKLKT